MKLSTLRFMLATTCAVAAFNTAAAEPGEPGVVTAPVERAFVPLGFDNNDNVEVIVHGHFPNTCYKVGPSSAAVDYATMTVTVEATAYDYAAGPCAQMLVPFTESVSIGTVKEGTYRVVVKDRPTAATTDLVVSNATSESADDFLYAPVEVADLQTLPDGGHAVRVEGRYPYTFVGCMVMKEVQLLRTPGNVIVVKPIAELLTGGAACDAQGNKKTFAIDAPLRETLEAGEYLLHVRALSGRSVNRVVPLDAR